MQLSIIIPTLNEEETLPLLLADLKLWNDSCEIIIADSGSCDNTISIAKIYSAFTLHLKESNRGYQLSSGANFSSGEWLLFLHADSRLNKNWVQRLHDTIIEERSKNTVWFFDLKIDSKRFLFRIMEFIVYIRSIIFKRPYGDQGLLIHKDLYSKIGGYKSLPLMEDLELIIRLSKAVKIKSLNIPIYTNQRKWKESNILIQSIKNAWLRYKWSRGESAYKLYMKYYKK